MNENKVSNRIISNVFWALAGKITGLISALLVGIFVARYLGPTQYGVMNYAVSFVTLFLVIATFGFENIEIREEAKANDQKDCILGTVFVLRVFLSFVTIVLISIVAYLNEADLYTYGIIMVYAITVMLTPFDVIRNYFTSLVQNEYLSHGALRCDKDCVAARSCFACVVCHLLGVRCLRLGPRLLLCL